MNEYDRKVFEVRGSTNVFVYIVLLIMNGNTYTLHTHVYKYTFYTHILYYTFVLQYNTIRTNYTIIWFDVRFPDFIYFQTFGLCKFSHHQIGFEFFIAPNQQRNITQLAILYAVYLTFSVYVCRRINPYSLIKEHIHNIHTQHTSMVCLLGLNI